MKEIHIEFVGGLWDGGELLGSSYDVTEARLAKKCYWSTKAGSVGEHFSELSAKEMHELRRQARLRDYMDMRHDYVVTVHVEDDREVFVRLECADEDLRA